ncbi:InlB B-repeat-containing protein [Paracholeplasma manati]|uniref:InlB B-repeat-containing protein n=1 Tax=Paracholeplasma manati TaxID=591373 RepID=A0ABT2Y5E6_9MOLU|nr:InlB B-repeat-containing protein [Paracholeplasma manati]MCV2231969.1 InlB B-repeat-containing protein [Paracholeplasma manati]MDG0888878.1 InlB B-repeat-containing protein [Paracholeplasma manati]
MKKILILFVTVLMLSLVGCSDGDPYDSIVSGDFIYTKWSMSEGEIAIIGLSDEGKQKDTLIFPFMLDGFKVTQIGSTFGLKDSGPLIIESANNIYFANSIINVETSIEYLQNNDDIIVNVYLGGLNFDSRMYAWTYNIPNSKVYLEESIYFDLVNSELVYGNFIAANIEYYIDENTLYFVDNAEGTLVNVVPPTPYKDGYEFVGWFKDTDFNQPFNFDEDVIPVKQFDDENKLINITKIYSKWQ